MKLRHLIALLALVAAPAPASPATAAPTAEDAARFIARAETELGALSEESARINWAFQTNINFDTEWLSAKNSERVTAKVVAMAAEARTFDGVKVSIEVRRKLDSLKRGITLPAPQDPKLTAELARLMTHLESAYSTGKIEFEGRIVPQDETEVLMRTLREPAKLTEVWTKWHATGRSMKSDYARMVDIANAGARDLGFANIGEMWRSGYDMTPPEFAIEVDRLWSQVKPLYDELHCHVRAKLNTAYGDEAAPLDEPIRADLLGNMWAQEWGAINDLVLPKSGAAPIDLTALLKEKGYTEIKIVKTGEAFFTSLGFDPLPQSFWEHSQIVKPRDREAVCHASAWDLDNRDDIRIKMCIKVDAENFQTVHHELGHNIYQRAYKNQPHLFKEGANDGFHEAIGDLISLSVTPTYLQQIGLIDKAPDASQDVNLLLQRAMDSVAFLPFGLLIDKWRWQVFSGELTPATYNDGWWRLRQRYQGVRPPVARGGDDFDPGAKYHVPGNTPYMRYFLARILQFQFFKAACDQIGWQGPLHRCSFYGAKDVGRKFEAMLAMGASQPWPDALEAFTGTRRMDGAAIVAYFEPLMVWLRQQNKSRTCGW